VSITSIAGAGLRSCLQYRKLCERSVSRSKQGPCVSRLAVRKGGGHGVSPTRQARRGLTDCQGVGSRSDRHVGTLPGAAAGVCGSRDQGSQGDYPRPDPSFRIANLQCRNTGLFSRGRSTKLPRQAIQHHRGRPSGYAGGPLLGLARDRPGDITKYLGATVPCLPQCEVTTG
jgi:hypothetical protein